MSSLPYYTNRLTYANVPPKALFNGLAVHANVVNAMVAPCSEQFISQVEKYDVFYAFVCTTRGNSRCENFLSNKVKNKKKDVT